MQTTPKELIDKYTDAGWWGQHTLHSLFQQALTAVPDRIALIDPLDREVLVGGKPKRLSFKQLDMAADQLASKLFDLGLRQGDAALLQMPNIVEIVVAYLAASRLGLILSPAVMQYGQYELAYFDEVIEPKAYIAFTQFKGEVFAAEQQKALSDQCKPCWLQLDELFINSSDDVNDDYSDYKNSLTIDANDIFTICWTSGTTGRSKGVPRSHNHWLSSTLASEDCMRLQQGTTILNPFPFVNMAAIGGFLFYWLKLQGTMVLHHPFEPMGFLQQLQQEKVEYTIAPPAVLTRLLQMKDQIKPNFDLSSLRIIGSGSAPLSPLLISGFKEEFGIDIVNIFGSNEGMSILSGPTEVADSNDRANYFPRFGRPEHSWKNRIAERIETKLVDPETDEEITQAGQAGECLIRGITVFDGYFKADEDNKKSFTDDGFFRSGDLFEIAGDQQQYYRFVGRCKSLIVRGGVNISPEELDELIEAHPSVVEAAVSAFPDDVLGERIAAVVVLHEGESLTLEDLSQYMADKKVAKFKWPERLVEVAALPRNAMNKVVRSSLSELLPS